MAYWGGEPTSRTDEQWSEVKAIDPRTGQPASDWRLEHPIVAPVLATAGDAAGRRNAAAPSGWGGWMKGFAPEPHGAPCGNALVVVALP